MHSSEVSTQRVTAQRLAAPHLSPWDACARRRRLRARGSDRAVTDNRPASQAAAAYVHGQLTAEGLRAQGVPPGHPIVRSFLGAPVLDRAD